jgi:signal transduction histidine kinase/CheY-like chemotaxis protein
MDPIVAPSGGQDPGLQEIMATVARHAPVAIAVHRAVRDDNGEVAEFSLAFVNEASRTLQRELISDPDTSPLVAVLATGGVLTASNEMGDLFEQFATLLETGIEVRYQVSAPAGDTSSKLDPAVFEIRATKFEDDIVSVWMDSTDCRREAAAAQRAAELATQTRNGFLSQVSHELRTPLNSILGFAQLLADDDLTDGQNECVQQVLDAGSHLLRLVDDVLQISRLDDGSMTAVLEPVAVVDAVASCIDLMRPLAKERGVRITVNSKVDSDQCVNADLTRLNQIVLNLLVNAIRYNKPQGLVDVVILRDGGRVHVTVNDTGLGMEPAELELAFAPFKRLRPTTAPGIGLGLTIARRLAEVMSGHIVASSTPGVGSSFRLDLPSIDLPEATSTPIATVHPPHEDERPALRILLVEDNPSNVRLLERVFARRPGVTWMIAITGQESLLIARSFQPEVILLDLCLPDLSGEEVIDALLREPTTCDIPIVAVSASADSTRMTEVLGRGAASYLTKPLDIRSLWATIESVVRSARRTAR